MNYSEAVKKLGSIIGTTTWHDYMSGAMLPSCREKEGIIKSLSVIYNKHKGNVKEDIEKEAEIQYNNHFKK